jgi:nucleotide-binding universal stress UspA family protein
MTFTRIVCGIEPGGGGVGAARRAARLAPQGTPLVLLATVDLEAASLAAQPLGGELDVSPMAVIPPAPALGPLEQVAREVLEQARDALPELPHVTTEVAIGQLGACLQEAVGDEEGALIALDAPEERRLLGLLDGNAATWLLHEAGRPVLVGRGPDDAEGFPGVVVVGVDGSLQSAAAARIAGEIAARAGAELRVVIASGGRGLHEEGIAAAVAGLPRHLLVEDVRHPVQALTGAGGDLIVVGHRGLHGLRALGSVSERVAHEADASVLVVR